MCIDEVDVQILVTALITPYVCHLLRKFTLQNDNECKIGESASEFEKEADLVLILSLLITIGALIEYTNEI